MDTVWASDYIIFVTIIPKYSVQKTMRLLRLKKTNFKNQKMRLNELRYKPGKHHKTFCVVRTDRFL